MEASKRAAESQHAMLKLKKQIHDLEKDLYLSKKRTDQIQNDLNTVITLLRKSWSGDEDAAQVLSKLVGAHPPQDWGSSRVSSAKARLGSDTGASDVGTTDYATYRMQTLYLEERGNYLDDLLRDDGKVPARLSRMGRNQPDASRQVEQLSISLNHLMGNAEQDPTGSPESTTDKVFDYANPKQYERPGIYSFGFDATKAHRAKSAKPRLMSASSTANGAPVPSVPTVTPVPFSNERAIKYEAVRPVPENRPKSGHPSSHQSRRVQSAKPKLQTTSTSNNNDSYTRQVHFAKISEEMNEVQEQEMEFRKHMAKIQERLGIPHDGRI